jgi:tyrosine-protein kinase Etk/Wzc
MTSKDIIHIIIFNRKVIFQVTVFTTLLLLLILIFVYPLTFNSPVTILPPENTSQFGNIGSLLSGQDFSSLLSGGIPNANSQLYSEILKSRTAALFVVNKYNLVGYYNADNIYEAAKKLEKDLNIEISKEGILKLSVDVSTPLFPLFGNSRDSVRNLSAALSNCFIEALDKINREKMSSKARNAREYIETQLTGTKAQLDSSENKLMEFQKANKAVALPEQLNAAIDAAAKLKSEIVKTEVDLGLMQENLQPDNKALMALKDKLQALNNQYDKMEMGNEDYLLAFKDVPELGKELAGLVRDVKIQNEVYMLLQQQYFKEKIQENRDIPTVQVLDKAIPPLKESGPRVIMSSLAGAVFIFLCVSMVFILGDRKLYIYKKD